MWPLAHATPPWVSAIPRVMPTGESAAPVSGMTTLFLPLAPNPVMGGFLTHVPDERVMPVDMTVREAARIIITSGIAADSPRDGEFRQLSEDELNRLARLEATEREEE